MTTNTEDCPNHTLDIYCVHYNLWVCWRNHL